MRATRSLRPILAALLLLVGLVASTATAAPAGARPTTSDGGLLQAARAGGTRLESIDAGQYHSCAVTATGTVDCWGLNTSGQATDQTGTTYTAVSTGQSHTCAITTTGTVDCWGLNTNGQATDQTALRYTAISAGSSHTCAITTTGTVDCWGLNTNGQAADQTVLRYTALAAGGSHTCAVTSTSTVDCWGLSTSGQAADQSATPYTAVAAGNVHSCALTVTGVVDCWGGNGYGQAADQSLTTYTSITSGYDHTCGLTAAGTVDCWGRSNNGQAADLTATTATAVAAGGFHTCALTTAGGIDCWGLGTDGQATDQAGTFRQLAVSGGWPHSCALLPSGTIDCWGNNVFEQSTDQSATTYTAVDAGITHTCALTTAGTVDCWGTDGFGEAVDQTGDTYTAVSVGGEHSCAISSAGWIDCWGGNAPGEADDQSLTTYTALDVGVDHSCAITTLGTVDCWGTNGSGQATDQVATTYTAISAGSGHTCAITVASTVDCWGSDTWGQATDQTATTYTSVSAGYEHTCALTTAGTVNCWGSDLWGQAADQTATTYTSVSAGYEHTCAVTTAGLLHCWGRNNSGQVGGAPTVISGAPPSPVPMGQAYSHTPTITPADIAASWTLTSGSLPPGLTLNASTGAITGTPTTPGTYTFTRTVTNIQGSGSQASTITVTGPPIVSAIADRTVTVGASTGPIAFVVSDDIYGTSSLTATGSSSNTTLVPNANVVVAGTGGARTVTVTPAAGQSGTTTITVTVSNPLALSTQETFVLTVVPDASSISGQITTGGATPVSGFWVAAFSATDGLTPTALAVSAADGTYQLANLPVGSYKVVAAPSSVSPYRIAWYEVGDPTGAPTRDLASALSITGPTSDPTGISIDLAVGAKISGTVTGPGGSPVAGVTVRALTDADTWVPSGQAVTAADGTYLVQGLPAGTFRVSFTPATTTLRTEWHNNVTSRASGTAHTLTLGQLLTGINAQLEGNNAITGTVTSGGNPLAGASVAAFLNGAFVPAQTVTTAADGSYAIVGLTPGTYRLRFTATGKTTQWWSNVTTRTAATDVVVTDGSLTTGRNAAMI